jgi:hypothetical protein
MKLVRAALGSSILLSSGIAAHHLSGGPIASAQSLTTFFLLSLLLTLLLLDEKLNEGRLFAAVFIAQNASHFILGGSTHDSMTMFASHTAIGIASFIAMSRACELLSTFGDVARQILSQLLPGKSFKVLAQQTPPRWRSVTYLCSFSNFPFASTFSLRAPPAQ